MRTNSRSLGIMLMAGVLILSGCSGADATDVEALVGEIQIETNELATEIENSTAATQLQDVWVQTRAEVTDAIESVRSDGDISVEELQRQLDTFQAALDEAGDAVEPELRRAWDSLRSKVERLVP